MPRKPVLGPARGLYAGLALAEWRGTIRALQRSGWWIFEATRPSPRNASALHFAVIQAATLLLPTTWHAANAGRLSPDYYRQRRGQVNARATFLHPPRQEERHET